jgi:hypothetical protein
LFRDLVASLPAAPYNAGMFAALRKNGVALLLIASHALAIAASEHFGLYWFLRVYRSPEAEAAVAATVLVVVGVDLGLLGLWAALSSCRPMWRRLATAACIVAWCENYEPILLWMLRNARHFDWQRAKYHFFFELAAPFGLALLTIAGITCARGVLNRRGGTFRRLTENEQQREAGFRQFQLSHLLLLTLVLSLVFGFSINGRQWLSRTISMRWQCVFEAPIYSAETVLFSAFCLATTTLTTAWAVLGMGRPWLRLAMAWAAAGFLGAAWAFAFTSPYHQEFLPVNAAFSAGVGLLQAALMSVVLLIFRRRGYRFAPETEGPARGDAETNLASG